MTIKRIILGIILIPIAIVLIGFIVANRKNVALSLDPLHTSNELLTYYAPLFVWLFASLALGIILGGVSVWFNQRYYRKSLKEKQAEVEKLKNDLTKISDLTISKA